MALVNLVFETLPLEFIDHLPWSHIPLLLCMPESQRPGPRLQETVANLTLRNGIVLRPLYEGEVLDIARIAKTLYERLTSEDDTTGRIYREKMLFEASTGVDCSGFFDKDSTLQYLPATAIMETFLESDDLNRFQPGQRYFFGHPIPK